MTMDQVSLPLLCSAKSWRITGRWDSYGPVLFRLKDRSNAALCLGPTHEETITQCIAEIGASNITPKLPLKYVLNMLLVFCNIVPFVTLLSGGLFL